ncbi:MAG TPA: glutaredoxin family protein [Burkholderiales bacterium]|nr:glutaredoxin family protein [Burkholderiales bacterium]
MLRTFLLVALIAPAIAGAQVVRWVDEKGRVHYGDKPPAGAAASPVQSKISSVGTPAARPKVMMYSTSWCGYCAKARSHFAKRGIPFEERDIERSAAWNREHKELGGRGVPLILVGGRRMNGYSAGSLDGLLDAEGF